MILNLSQLAEMNRNAILSVQDSAPSAVLGGLLARIIGHIPDEQWADMMESSHRPCNHSDCDCANLQSQVFDALDELRDDFRADQNIKG